MKKAIMLIDTKTLTELLKFDEKLNINIKKVEMTGPSLIEMEVEGDGLPDNARRVSVEYYKVGRGYGIELKKVK